MAGDAHRAIRHGATITDHPSFDDVAIEPGKPDMAHSMLTLKTNDDMRANEPRGRRKIDPSEWPNLLAKRQRGATQAEIAREYGVSQGTVSQILKRARDDARNAQPAAPAAASTDSPAQPSRAAAAPTAESGGSSAERRPGPASSGRTTLAMPANRAPDSGASATRSAPAEHGSSQSTESARNEPARGTRAERSSPTALPSNDTPRNDAGRASEPETPGGSDGARRSGNALADRLRDAAEHAANLVDADAISGDQLGQAVHEVRRALAAIEIDAAKRASHAVRPAMPEPDDIDDNEQFGRIKFFKPEKGFGFIIPDDGGDDVFLSSKTASAAGLDNLTQGDRVRFVPGPGSKGLEAKSIERDD